jgi:hypothetical protein
MFIAAKSGGCALRRAMSIKRFLGDAGLRRLHKVNMALLTEGRTRGAMSL